MAIEHRWSERKPISMQVQLDYEPLGSVDAQTLDLSLEGMRVRADGWRLPVNARLKVCFTSDTRIGKREHRLPACVVHEDAKGVGLMLKHKDYSDLYVLRQLLNAA